MTRLIVIASLLAAGSEAAAQDLGRYRDYVLGGSVASVLSTSRGREADVRTIHTRPALVQTFEWHTPYMRPVGAAPDSVRDIAFSFCDDQLYRIVVSYDRSRTEGLTDDDVIAALSATYGAPKRPGPDARAMPADLPFDAVVVATWEGADALLVLARNSTARAFQLALTSKAAGARAHAAISEAVRLDAIEAPQRELDRRRQETADAADAAATARTVNKGAFRP